MIDSRCGPARKLGGPSGRWSMCYHLCTHFLDFPSIMKVDTFSVRDLRERIGDLTRDAESGRLSLVTKRGRPLFVAVPFSEELLREGVGFSLALQLYREGVVTAGRGATIAGMGLAEFLEEVSHLETPVVDYAPEELAEELEQLG